MFSDWEVLIHNQQKLYTLLGKDKGTEGFSLKGWGGLLLIVLCSNCLISLVPLACMPPTWSSFEARSIASGWFRNACGPLVIDSCK